jgi:hypothetical protein
MNHYDAAVKERAMADFEQAKVSHGFNEPGSEAAKMTMDRMAQALARARGADSPIGTEELFARQCYVAVREMLADTHGGAK